MTGTKIIVAYVGLVIITLLFLVFVVPMFQ